MIACLRIATTAVLLLHLIFGCSLHHADGRCGHTGNHGSSVPGRCSRDVEVNHGCCHVSDRSSTGLSKAADRAAKDHRHADHRHADHGPVDDGNPDHVRDLCCCHSLPCDGNLPGCHHSVDCSYVPPQDLVYTSEARLVAYLTYDHDPLDRQLRSVYTACRWTQAECIGADSLAHCASLCTWLI